MAGEAVEVRILSRDGRTLRGEELAVFEAERLAKQAAKKAAKREAKQRLLDAAQDDDQEYGEFFDAAQQQLEQEMASAGLEGMLPMSFGGNRAVSRPKAKKRRRTGSLIDPPVEDKALNEAHVVVADEPAVETRVVAKLHVKFDSDGEETERVTENVEITVPRLPETNANRDVDGDGDEAAIEDVSTANGNRKREKCPVHKSVRKFWEKRNLLFYKYEEGIQLDRESWYSVTPEPIAEYIAERCRCDVIVDPFAGCGGNVIQLAKTCRTVIAIDIDPEKIRMAKHNAAIYGVADKIEFIVGDSIEILPTLKADVVFLSPPWGGMKYSRTQFNLDEMVVKGASGTKLFELARRVSRNIVYYLPKTTPVADLEALSPEEDVTCELVVLNDKMAVMTAYYGGLAAPTTANELPEP